MLGLFLVSDAHADYPQVSFASPSDGSTVNGEVNIRVNASDTDGIARVDLYIDGEKRASKSSGPFEWTWGSNENGTHQLAARAYDKLGYSRTVGVKITKGTGSSSGTSSGSSGDTTAPSVSFSSPRSGATVEGEIKIGVNASDSSGIARVDLYINGEKRSSKTAGPFEWNWNSTDDGTYYLMVKAYDKAGNEGSALINIKRGSTQTDSGTASGGDTTPPSVSFASPGNGSTVDGEVKIQVNASDSGGMDRVDLYINGEKKASKSSGPYEWTWGSTSDGKFNLTAKAYDRAGNGSTATTSVTRTSTSTTSPIPSTSSYAGGALPVFPGAEGYGTTTSAGRGGKIIKVTNLNAYGPGSLREALSTSGRRIIVFEVGGIIDLTYNQSGGDGSFLYLTEPYCTIAGQTAPYPGITIKGAGFRIKTHDVLIQHLAIRPGDHPRGPRPDARDAIAIRGPSYNVVIDHVSASWGVDENVDTWPEPTAVSDITVSNSIISEGLNRSIHPEGAHSKGFLIGDGSKNVAVIGNLFAHNDFRNPQSKGGVSAAIVNNVVYNPGRYNFMIVSTDRSGLGPNKEAFMGNLFIKGPNTSADIGVAIGNNLESGTAIYHKDNAFADGVSDRPFASVPPLSSIQAYSPPLDIRSIALESIGTLEQQVLSYAGSRPMERDSVDRRIVNEVKSRSGRIIDSQNQVGGWPQLSKTYKSLPIPSNPNGDDDGDGYTNIEELLHQMAQDLE